MSSASLQALPSVRTRVKICCIMSPEEAAMAIAAGADALGMVGAMPTGPGPITDDQIAAIAAETPPGLATFVLTSETEGGRIAEHAIRTGANTVQIVQHIDPAEYPRLIAAAPAALRRVQVIHVEDRGALDLIEAYAPHVHAFLLDSGRPAIQELGGTGRTHDWAISAEFVARSPRPVFLAGGLRPENVGVAIRTVRPYGLDLCTGVRRDGRLDPTLLRAFFDAVRAAD